ncbi:hypothetical protein PMIN03_001418 [Paraphaeosphaeria minitans]
MALNRQGFANLLAEARGEPPPTLSSDASAKEASPLPDQQRQPAISSADPASTTTTSTSDTLQSQPLDMSAKRSSTYKQGQPGREYDEERPDEPADEPRRATAAQLAQRKIRTLKGPRKAGGASSGLAAFNPNPPAANAFNFGPDPNAGAASNPFAQQQSTPGGSMFGQSQPQTSSGTGSFAFGSNSTSSFPPAQPSPPNNPFAQSTNSSFPPASGFGGSNAGSASPFNPQPDMNLGGTAPSFGASAPAPTSGFTFGSQSSQTPAFGALQSNAASTPAAIEFGFLGAAAKNNESTPVSGGVFNNNNASTSAPSGGLFSTNSTPQNSTFGGFGPNANTSTAAPTSPFGNPFDKVINASAPFQFGGFGSAVKSNANSQAPSTPFGSSAVTAGGSTPFGANTSGFTFGAQSNGPNAPGTSTKGETTASPAFSFGNSLTNAATPAPSTNLFGSFGGFGQVSQAQSPSNPVHPSTTLPDLFSQPQEQAPTGPVATPLSKKRPRKVQGNSTSDDQSAEASREEPAKIDTTAQSTPKQTPSEATRPTQPSQFEQSAANPFASVPSSAPASISTNNSLFTPLKPAASSSDSSTNSIFASMKPAATSFDSTSNSIFSPAKPAAPTFSSPSSSSIFTPANPAAPTTKPALTGIAASVKEPTNDAAALQVAKVAVPSSWTLPDQDSADLREHIQLLEQINDIYRAKVAHLPARADWSALSRWHFQESSKLKKKIDDIKKQAATAKGITGKESILSTKQKTDDSAQLDSPIKKARGGEAPTTPKASAPALPSTTPKANPFSKSFNLFANSSTQQSSDEWAQPKATESQDSASRVGFKPNFNTSTSSGAIGFTPDFGTSSSSNATGFKPSFDASSRTGGSGGSGFFGQFGGKTKEQLLEERMKKALEEGYESPTTSEEAEGDYETREQYMARWKKEENERQAALDAAANDNKLTFAPTTTSKNANTPIFKLTAASSNAASSSDSIVASQGCASGASTTGFLGSRVSSPAPSTEEPRSVLDTPLDAQTPSSNLFGHLSGASSRHQEDSDDEADDEAVARPSVGEDSKKRKLGNTRDADSESSETLEESIRRKKPATQTSNLTNSDTEQAISDTPNKGRSLADRMTRDPSPTAAGEEPGPPSLNSVNSKLYNVNGSQTPAAKSSFKFDFDSAAAKAVPQSAPPKQNIFAGDQTFKPGAPILFGSSTNSIFKITPPTPSPVLSSEPTAAPLKAVNSPFSFLSAAPSAATSAMSSRAATPASDADASASEGPAVNEEEALNHVESDKSVLTSQENDEYDVLFEAEQVIVNKQVRKEGVPKAEWQKIANGRLFVMKSKADNHVILRLRMKSGAVRVNYRIPSALKSSIMGANMTQVLAREPTIKDGKSGIEIYIFAFNHKDKTTKQELAQKFSDTYNMVE